jgi:lysophospholipase L1-like esterase
MIHQNIALHNVVELDDAPGGGVLLRRWPQPVREGLSPLGRVASQESAGCELRFVTEAKAFRLSLGALPSPIAPHACDVVVFRGPFFHSHHRIEVGRVNHLNLGGIGAEEKLDAVRPEYSYGCGFAGNLWRVFFGRYPAIFYALDTYDYKVCPPREDETPPRKWIAYGSSITSGAGATMHHYGYVYHAARALNLDVLNHGLSGSCLCEPEVAEYLAARECDLLTLEIGVNMRAGFSPEQFRERAAYLMQKVAAVQPERKVFVISIYPNFETAGIVQVKEQQARTEREVAFNETLRELAAEYSGFTLIDGAQILSEFSGLNFGDMIHPSDYGHALMGANLATQIRAAL